VEQLLKLCATAPGGRIVSTNDLSEHQIAEASTAGLLYIDGAGFGWAFLSWNLTTKKDREREAAYFSRNGMMI
jgi:hypothetical protein